MSRLILKDLTPIKDLDQTEQTAIRGGLGEGTNAENEGYWMKAHGTGPYAHDSEYQKQKKEHAQEDTAALGAFAAGGGFLGGTRS